MVAPNKRKGITNYDIELRNQKINPKSLKGNNCTLINLYCFLDVAKQKTSELIHYTGHSVNQIFEKTGKFIYETPESILYGLDTISQKNDEPFNVHHVYVNEASLSIDEHFSAILAENAYSLTDSNTTNNSLPEIFKQNLDNYANIYPVHQETIKNSKVLEANSEYALIKDNRPIIHDGKTGNVCYTTFRGTDLYSNQTLPYDIVNDAFIFFGYPPNSIFRLNKEIPDMLNRHPECIFNIGTGHSLGASKSTYLNQHFDSVYAFEPGQTNWSIRYHMNINRLHDNSNTTEFRISCDFISKGTGPLNGNVYHLKTENGLGSCHSMNNWIRDSRIRNDNLITEIQLLNEEFLLSNFNQNNSMNFIPDGFYDSIQSNSSNINKIFNIDEKPIIDNIEVEKPIINNIEAEKPIIDNIEVEKPENKDMNKNNDSLELMATKNLTTLNQGLNLINGISHFHNFNDNEKSLFIVSTILDQLKTNIPDIFNEVKNELNIFGNMLTSFLQDGKIKIEQIVMDICQNKFGVPLNGVKSVLESIIHHGRNLKESIKSLIQDCIIYSVPYAQVAFLVYQSFHIFKSFLTHTSVIEIGGFSLTREIHSSLSFKRGHYRTVTLKNDILDITITSRRKHKNDADADAEARFKEEAMIKAYQVYGIDYDYFNDLKDSIPENRYEKYKEMLYFNLTQEYWKDINKLSEEEKITYKNAMFESDEMKSKRIKFEILGKKFSYYDTNNNKDIYHFVCDLKCDFLKCQNNTERAKFIYSLFCETGHSKDDQVHFSKFTKFILELFNIDISKFENYINYQNELSDQDLDDQVKKKKEEESKNIQDFLIELRNRRSQGQNDSLTDFNNDQKHKKSTNTDEYSLANIRKNAHMELLKYEISADFVFKTISSSVTSNFLSSVVYIDKEYLRIKKEGLMYIPSKSLELTSGCIQSYSSNFIANHISLDLSLRERLFFISDEIFQDVINPNIQLLTSLGVSSLVKSSDGSLKNKNMGRCMYDISENVLKTNGLNLINYFSPTEIKITDLIVLNDISNDVLYNSIFDYLNAPLDFLSYILGSTSIYTTLGTMIFCRVLRNIIFPEIQPEIIDYENLKDIEERNKNIIKLIEDISDDSVSYMKKCAIKKELQIKGIIKYEKLPIEEINISNKRNISSNANTFSNKLVKDKHDRSISYHKKNNLRDEIEILGNNNSQMIPISNLKLSRKRNMYSGKNF